MKYENRRNGKVATLISRDDKFKTVMMEYEDGTTQPITEATLKRWWKKVENEPEVVVKEETMETEQEATMTEVDAVENVVQEVVEQVKEKPVRVKKTKEPKQENPHIQEILDYIYNISQEFGGIVWTPAKDIKMRTIKVGGHNCIKLNYSGKSVIIGVRPCVVQGQPDKTINHMFGALYTITELTDETKELISNLTKVSLDYQIRKNTSK
jgi:hypothetical protein